MCEEANFDESEKPLTWAEVEEFVDKYNQADSLDNLTQLGSGSDLSGADKVVAEYR
jgi:hypothetical protein